MPILEDGQTAQRIEQLLRVGNRLNDAIRAAGVAQRTHELWMQLGAKEDGAELYRDYRQRVEKASAEGRARNVTLIATHAKDDWKAAAWLLERQDPAHWARPVRSVSNEDEQPPAEAPTGTADPFEAIPGDELAAARSARRGPRAPHA
jgi:hypothetical protein